MIFLTKRWKDICKRKVCRKCLFCGACGIFYYLLWFIKSRYFGKTNELFDDASHIVYVNGNYKREDTIGRLMHDFGCKEAEDMYYPKLAKGVRYFKEEGGR